MQTSEILRPAGAGASTQWVPSAGANYTCVDEAILDISDYLGVPGPVQSDALDLYALSTPIVLQSGDTINSVTVYVYWANTTDATIALALRENTTNTIGTTIVGDGTGVNLVSQVWSTRPSDGLAWEYADILALQGGQKYTISFGTFIYQVYVKVDFTQAPASPNAMSTAMQLRIHSYSLDPDYGATLEYFRDTIWNDLTDRLLTRDSQGQEYPIKVVSAYRQMYTADLTLENSDGLLTPENETSAFNLDIGDAYDALLDNTRKMRLGQGIYCYPSLSSGQTVTSDVAPTTGALTKLVDYIYGSPTNEADTDWVHWSTVASGASIAVKMDLGTSQNVRHGMISFLSKSGASPQIELPATVQFAYSTDDSTYVNIGDAFDLSKYKDSTTGKQCLAWFTDLNKDARYIRATITNIAEENEIYIDEFDLWGGSSTTLVYKTMFTGYLGDRIYMNANAGTIEITLEDTRKRENDNRKVELTRVYKNKRAEEIIYDLLTYGSYWRHGGIIGSNILTNGGFEDGWSPWTNSNGRLRSTSFYLANTGTICVDFVAAGGWVKQSAVPVSAVTGYQIYLYHMSRFADATFHIDLTFDAGAPQRWPDVGSYTSTNCGVDGWYTMWKIPFTTPAGCSTVDFQFTQDNDTHAGLLDDVGIYLADTADLSTEYDSPLQDSQFSTDGNGVNRSSAWVTAGVVQNLSDFNITKWQGQQGTILDYCNELAELIGWVYDSDADGLRRFWQPAFSQIETDTYLSYFARREIGPDQITRTKSDKELINLLKIVGYETGNKEVPRTYRHEDSIDRYGERYARITEPLVKNKDASEQLKKSIFRDFAYARDLVDAQIMGDFDIDYPKMIVSFDEPVRSYIDKDELWTIESNETEMLTAGHGSYRQYLNCKKYMGSQPDPVANIVGTGASTQVTITWDANTEADLDGYYVYWKTTPYGTFNKSTKVTAGTETKAITGLTNSTAYWFYVTAVNLDAIESDPSAIIRCLAGVGNSGSEALSWGIAGLAVTLTDQDPSVKTELAWTPSLFYDPDYILLSVCGPALGNTPTIVYSQGKLSPADGVAISAFANYVMEVGETGDTYYWRVAITEVVINDVHYRFGTPLYSNAPSAVWP